MTFTQLHIQIWQPTVVEVWHTLEYTLQHNCFNWSDIYVIQRARKITCHFLPDCRSSLLYIERRKSILCMRAEWLQFNGAVLTDHIICYITLYATMQYTVRVKLLSAYSIGKLATVKLHLWKLVSGITAGWWTEGGDKMGVNHMVSAV